MKAGDRVKMTALGYEQLSHPRTIRSGVVERVTAGGMVCVRISRATVQAYHPDYWEVDTGDVPQLPPEPHTDDCSIERNP